MIHTRTRLSYMALPERSSTSSTGRRATAGGISLSREWAADLELHSRSLLHSDGDCELCPSGPTWAGQTPSR